MQMQKLGKIVFIFSGKQEAWTPFRVEGEGEGSEGLWKVGNNPGE